jgi:large subunit ribosomal protein L9
LAKSEVLLPDGPLRQVGEYDITIRLHPEVQAVLKMHVVAE